MEIEPRHVKTGILHMRKQRQRSAAISVFVFATWLVRSLFYLNPKFQASSNLPCLYRRVCGPGQKPRRPVFSQRDSIHFRGAGRSSGYDLGLKGERSVVRSALGAPSCVTEQGPLTLQMFSKFILNLRLYISYNNISKF